MSKRLKMKNKGFTIIELITAIAILAVLSVSVTIFMSTSSKTYSKLSVESQLQSEAQLVANMITELAIDSFDAVDETTENFGYPSDKGKILVLDSMAEDVKKQYIVGLKADEEALYLAERTFDATNGTWGEVTEALLGNYIVDFKVDASRVKEENMLMFTLCYDKGGRQYDGNYQVLMRNRAYADKEEGEVTPESNASVAIRLSPQLVYVDIINENFQTYYVDTIADGSNRSVTGAGIPFAAEVYTNQRTADKNVDWELKNEDEEIFEMDTLNGTTSNLTWSTDNKAFKNSPTDAFTLVITKTIEVGDKTIDANPKTAQILLRRIKSINLFALSGATGWTNEFTESGGQKAPDANGYVYTGANGKYLPLNLNAAITASNIAYGGGVSWELYMKNDSGDWDVCTNASFAKIRTKKTETSTTNTVTMGSAAKNGQVYKVVATSLFDPSYEAEYVFGVAPSTKLDGDGFNSRGFYTNMSAFMDGKTAQSDNVPVSQLVYLKVTKVDGSSNVGDWEDKVKIVKDGDGNWRLFVNYDAFSYSGPQKADFYKGSILIHLTYGYYGPDGKLYINGEGAGRCKAEMAAMLGVSENEITQYSQDFIYKLNEVIVSKISPAASMIVVEKGADRTVNVKTAFYNILSPRNGMYYFGTYIEDMYNNLLQPGKTNINPYFSVSMTSTYGDTDQFVDTATVRLSAKALSSQKKYMTDPVTLRFTANDYYLINTNSPYTGSYTDYKLVLANVEGTDCFIPGPEFTDTSSGLSWPAAAETSNAEVQGLRADGAVVTSTAYKSGKKYYLKYAGRTYTYNSTYNFWAK